MQKLFLGLLLCLLIPTALFSEEGSRLNQISEKIEALKSSQQRIEKDIKINSEETRKISAELTRLETEISQINERKKELSETAALLTEQIEDTVYRISELKSDSSKRLRALYISPSKGGLVNTALESDLNSASRYIWYFKKLRAYELQVLNEMHRLNNSLASQKKSLSAKQSEIESASARIIMTREDLLNNQSRQAKLVSDLKRQKSENAKLVSQLRSEYLRIETAIASLSADQSVALASNDNSVIKAAGQAEIVPAQDSASLFATKFPAPVNGRLVSRFGSKIEDTLGSKIASKGLGFAAAEGSEVLSVGAGRVVFSGFLGDYGQVVIVDHGGRVHTLYSMLESSEVKAGQQLQAQSVIGKVGKIESPKSYNAYFELRVAGLAQNPEPRMEVK